MEAVICGLTALDYWRKHADALGSPVSYRAVPERRGKPKIDTPSAFTIQYLQNLGLTRGYEVDLLLPSEPQRRVLKGVHYRVISEELPARSFVRTRGQVYVVSPELLFLMAANKLSLAKLLELGHELCGTYRLTEPHVTYGVKPLTSASAIRTYVQRAKGVRGRAAALKACVWLADGSASPAETALSIMFRLPYRYGGYGLGSPLLNHKIPLNEGASTLLGGQSMMKPDFFWTTKKKYPSEYDSSLYHSAREQADSDERRRNAYAALGLGVTVIRPRHLCNIRLLDEIAASIRKNTGLRLGRLPADYQFRHSELFEEVFRYWIELRDSRPSTQEYLLGAYEYSEPRSPW